MNSYHINIIVKRTKARSKYRKQTRNLAFPQFSSLLFLNHCSIKLPLHREPPLETVRHPEEKKKLCKLLVFYGSKKKSAKVSRRIPKTQFQYLPRRTILKMEEKLFVETIKARALTVMIFCLISGQVLTNLF
ncbi:hypothetical protein SOMG_03688 [Schizosaccharomyces osmophilus]|uniref:Uncharacterized protein n=1 Tax=Schizosaccharomyces osmophilus TaxID=2545709 RepID=A0AAF0AVD7_9SCHI|nr:uncharacterized protein SOMG_03688 [Schizosaccharomyces osmophilus]WBW73456.1 hypothetical protein SOMG_03688 [Schizosaccharomyces osmophilus]